MKRSRFTDQKTPFPFINLDYAAEYDGNMRNHLI
jgi:hypothetical protein